VSDHLGLDFDLVELLSGVDTDDGTDHLGDNDHVTEVGLDEIGLLVGLGLLLGLAELLDQTHGLALETTVEASAGTGVDDITELLRREVEELLKVDATVGELLERSLGLDGYLRQYSVSSIVLFPSSCTPFVACPQGFMPMRGVAKGCGAFRVISYRQPPRRSVQEKNVSRVF
jgi:hypothetical protein